MKSQIHFQKEVRNRDLKTEGGRVRMEARSYTVDFKGDGRGQGSKFFLESPKGAHIVIGTCLH